jgi:hypothetical protein
MPVELTRDAQDGRGNPVQGNYWVITEVWHRAMGTSGRYMTFATMQLWESEAAYLADDPPLRQTEGTNRVMNVAVSAGELNTNRTIEDIEGDIDFEARRPGSPVPGSPTRGPLDGGIVRLHKVLDRSR